MSDNSRLLSPQSSLAAMTANGENQPDGKDSANGFVIAPPSVSLPKGGGAIRGIGEKFSSNPVTGTGSMSFPIALSQGRSGFGPQLNITYDSGAGQGIFGLGWNLALPSITRKTDKGLPRYSDDVVTDVFLLSGAEDLVPVLDDVTGERLVHQSPLAGNNYQVYLYRPRIEGLFARIERWTQVGHPQDSFWRTITRDNITTWYGRDEESRIFEPGNPARIFEWLICQTNDDKGNIVVYRYVAENSSDVDRSTAWEANRHAHGRQANRYPKRILYGNTAPYLPSLDPLRPDPLPGDWMFEAVFDYGDHASPFPTPQPDGVWKARIDAFSSYRAGFEVRTYRLCRRVLMFHHFPEATEVGQDCLVRSTDFDYEIPETPADPQLRGYTVLRSVTHTSYQKTSDPNNPYNQRSLPPVAFTYSQPVVNQVVQTIEPEQLENLPVGTQGPGYRWIDLDGEGLSGVLSEQLGGWYYKQNMGAGKFGPMRVVAPVPAMAAAGRRYQFIDLTGDGEIAVVDFDGPTPGFHERDPCEGWTRHVPFASLPNIEWQDPNLRFVDLTGDGIADALITEQDVFTWYSSLEEKGFAAAERTWQAIDENTGPHLIFANGSQTIFLADMSGDSLTDLVRVRNGEVCYWPNLGYGRFGRKITLGNSPLFDQPDLYDPARIRLADIDGSGPIDVIYLGRDGARLYFNRSGNTLSDALAVDLPLASENLNDVQVADLLGNGTACLVWNSRLPTDAGRPVYYIDLMGGAQESIIDHLKHEKPHLLIGVDNNLGGTTGIEYTPSTRFYLQDREAGTLWVTRLPFPVHCVSKVTVHDKWLGTAFSSTYSYHHGYFDGVEREFRGFGRVEQVDVENYGVSAAANAGSPYVTGDQTLYQPPVKTITWYHTGAALERQRILSHFEHEYFPARFSGRLPDPALEPNAFREKPLSDPELPSEMTADEWREALRACKGMVLRQEVYELDVDDIAAQPPRHTPVRLLSAATHNWSIQRLQARGGNLHSVFLVTESEALSYHYELALPKDQSALQPDPRIAHTLNLRSDEQGNLQQSVAIGYGRWRLGNYTSLPRQELIAQVQGELHIAYSESRYTSDVILTAQAVTDSPVRHYRLRLPFESLTFELKGIPKKGVHYYELEDFRLCDLSTLYGHRAGETPPVTPVQLKQYHETADGSQPQMRNVEHARTAFFDDSSDTAPPDNSNPLPFGQHGPRGLKYEDYKLALTDALLSAVFSQSDTAGLAGDMLSWEVQSAQGATSAQTARDLLADPAISGYWHDTLPDGYWMRSGRAGFANDAQLHFFLPERYADPFGNLTLLDYDARHLFVRRTTDAKGNITAIVDDAAGQPRYDYRVLAPLEMVDPSGNHVEARFDILGRVAASAVKGKQNAAGVWQGDNLDGLTDSLVNPPEANVVDFCTRTTLDAAQARIWLGNAGARFVYHFGQTLDSQGAPRWAARPSGACTIVREIHRGQPGGDTSALQVSLQCSDGGGNVLMKKQQAEPEQDGGALRWIVNGLTVLNNKGKPVKQYEPAFSDQGFGCETPQANSVATVIFYDAPGRVIRTEFPDGTLSRVEFSPWHSQNWDRNDTVLESAWYQTRNSLPPENRLPVDITTGLITADPEQRAGWLAARHANTPVQTLFDSLGRDVISIAHNRVKDAGGAYTFDGTQWKDDFYLTFTRLDAEGKPLWIRDARGNLVMQYIAPPKPTRLADQANEDIPSHADPNTGAAIYSAPCYDIAGNLLYQHSMDAGDRWMLMDAAGKPMLAWDFNQWQEGANFTDQHRLYRTRYDALHRPAEMWLRIWSRPNQANANFNLASTEMVERFEYQDSQPNDVANLNGQLIRHFDPSGSLETIRRDFKGNVEEVHRNLASDPTVSRIDWLNGTNSVGTSKLESDTYIRISEYDALSRMTTLFNWHRDGWPVAVYQPQYNERGLLRQESIRMHATKTTTGFDPNSGQLTQAIQGLRYNAKGQKEWLKLGNDTTTQYDYDPLSFRLRQIFTNRPPPKATFPGYRSNVKDPNVFQQLLYTYDAAGNITEIEDQAYQPVFFDGGIAEPRSLYEYDALYRLTWAQGREAAQGGDSARDEDEPVYGKGFPVTDQTLRRYTQSYTYDAAGNFVTLQHSVPLDTASGWTRNYTSALDSNRLLSTQQGNAVPVTYGYDSHGNMLNLIRSDPRFNLCWDHRDMIRAIDLGSGKAFYQYDAGKQRTRKRIQRNDGSVEERIYLGGYELYRRTVAGAVVEQIESHHLFHEEQRVLLVDDVSTSGQTLFRYQYSNHLGSACVELDHDAEIISYEEYHPYGTSAYRALKSGIGVPPKRYRYTGMERDKETGLNYHGARYYMPWFGRWASTDPSGMNDGPALYAYCKSNPINWRDGTGMKSSQLATNSERLAVQVQESANDLRDAYGLDRVEIITQQPIDAAGNLLEKRKAGSVVPDQIRLPLSEKDVGGAVQWKARSIWTLANLEESYVAADMVAAIRQTSDDIARAQLAYPLGDKAKGQVGWILSDSRYADPKIARGIANSFKEQIRTKSGVIGTAVAAELENNPNVKGVTVTTMAEMTRARDASVRRANQQRSGPNGSGAGSGTSQIVLGFAGAFLPGVVANAVSDAVPRAYQEGTNALVSIGVQAGIDWVGLVGPQTAAASATVIATAMHPAAGVAVSAVASSATAAFAAPSIAAIGTAGAGAVGVAGVSVVAAGAAGYAVGSEINKTFIEPLVDKAAPGSGALGDWYYRNFLK
jgi:RHS repeat-associated protein